MKKKLLIAAFAATLALAGRARAEDPAPAEVMSPLEESFMQLGIYLDDAEHCGMGADAHAYAFSHFNKMLRDPVGHEISPAERAHLRTLFVRGFNYNEKYWDIYFDYEYCNTDVQMVEAYFPGIPNHTQWHDPIPGGSKALFAQ